MVLPVGIDEGLIVLVIEEEAAAICESWRFGEVSAAVADNVGGNEEEGGLPVMIGGGKAILPVSLLLFVEVIIVGLLFAWFVAFCDNCAFNILVMVFVGNAVTYGCNIG